LLKKT